MNFPLILFVLLLLTGAIWLLDIFLLKKQRASDQSEPWWVEYPKSFFPDYSDRIYTAVFCN